MHVFTVKPRISEEEVAPVDPQTYRLGQEHKLTCTVFGFPKPNITWLWQPCDTDHNLTQWVDIARIYMKSAIFSKCRERSVYSTIPLFCWTIYIDLEPLALCSLIGYLSCKSQSSSCAAICCVPQFKSQSVSKHAKNAVCSLCNINIQWAKAKEHGCKIRQI